MAGDMKGFDDPRGDLFFYFVKALKKLNPTHFMMENVIMPRNYVKVMNKELGVESKIINSNRFICQNRNRHYWTNFKIDKLPKKILWNNSQYKINKELNMPLLITDDRKNNLKSVLEGGWVDRESSFCITSSYVRRSNLKSYFGGNTQIVFNDDGSTRLLTPLECERLQGLPDNYTHMLTNKKRYEVIGNCWTVPVIKHILGSLFK